MNTVLELERLGYRFSLIGEKIVVRRYGSGAPPEKALALLKQLKRQDVLDLLKLRETGHTILKPHEIYADSDKIAEVSAALKTALDKGDLMDVTVVFNKERKDAVFYVYPPYIEYGI